MLHRPGLKENKNNVKSLKTLRPQQLAVAVSHSVTTDKEKPKEASHSDVEVSAAVVAGDSVVAAEAAAASDQAWAEAS